MSEEVKVCISLRDAEYIYDYIWDMPDSAIKDNILGKIYKWDRKRTASELLPKGKPGEIIYEN